MPSRGSPVVVLATIASAVAIAATLVAGPGASAGPVVALLALADAGLVVVVARGGRHDRRLRRLVIGLGGLLVLLAVVRPPTGSHDVWSYALYGRMAARHGDPYVASPRRFSDEPVYRQVDPLWRGTRSVYGPAFTVWSSVLGRVAGRSPLRLRLAFQLTAAAAVVGAAVVLDRRTGGDPRALALVVLNPLVLCTLVNDAHVDAVIGLLVLAGVLAAERRRPGVSGALLGLGVLVKAIALLPAGALGLWLLAGRRVAPVARYALALVLVVAAGYAVEGGTTALRPLGASSSHLTRASVWGPARQELVTARVDHGMAPGRAKQAVGHVLGLLASVVVVAGTVALVLSSGSRAGPAVVAGGAVLAYMLLGAYVLPWYAAAGLFVLVLAPRWPPTWLFLAHAAVLQLVEVPGRRFLHRLPPGSVDRAWHGVLQRSFLPPLELAFVVAVVLTARRGLPAT